MIKVITQDGLAKYELANYEVVRRESRMGGWYIATPEFGGKFLALYTSKERAISVFDRMIQAEADQSENQERIFILPEEEDEL